MGSGGPYIKKMYEYENIRRICYGEKEGEIAVFIPVCIKCGQFVKADKTIKFGEAGLKPESNATCKKHGRVEMIFEGFF